MKLWKWLFLALGISAGTLSLANKTNCLMGNVWQSYQGVNSESSNVEVVARGETENTNVGADGYWFVGFIPPLLPTDSAHVSIYKIVGPDTFQAEQKKEPIRTLDFHTVFLNDPNKSGWAVAVGPEHIKDVSITTPMPFRMKMWTDTFTDTADYYDYYWDSDTLPINDIFSMPINSELLPDSLAPGQRAFLRLYKQYGDTTISSDTSLIYNPGEFGKSVAALDTFFFYGKDTTITGIEEEKETRKDLESKFNVCPTVGNRFSVSGGKFRLVNSSGQVVGKYGDNVNATTVYDFDVPSGVHFIVPENEKGKGKAKKIVVVR